MKNLSAFHKLVFFINNIFALLLVIALFIPYFEPKSFPKISVLSLAAPVLLFTHVLFIAFWILVGFKKQFLLSSFCVLLAITFSYFPYKFSRTVIETENNISVMSYNVRNFNRYLWIDDKDVPNKISKFIADTNPDILCLQEYYNSKEIAINFPYQYVEFRGAKSKTGQAIFSKYKIINKGSLDFKKSRNNAIFADILRDSDTIRIYNIHLESLGIRPDSVYLSEQNSKRLLYRLSESFVKQQAQVEQFVQHKKKCKSNIVITGDFNNTAYSWAYDKIKDDFQDTFLQAGNGFGKTYTLKKYPLRIDFILVSEKFQVNEHQNFKIKFSDHEPILARLSN